MENKLRQLNYFELLDLMAWCDERIEQLGLKGTYYMKLKEAAAKVVEEKTLDRCLSQFLTERNLNIK